jgi:hypothetical protein
MLGIWFFSCLIFFYPLFSKIRAFFFCPFSHCSEWVFERSDFVQFIVWDFFIFLKKKSISYIIYITHSVLFGWFTGLFE